MTTLATLFGRSGKRFGFKLSQKIWLTLGYLSLLSLPFLATFALDMAHQDSYATTLMTINMLAMMAFYIQFPLASRLKQIPLFANIDWSISRHKKVGQWLGIIFLFHPILILAPRFMVSFNDGMHSLISVITAPQMLTGLIAWVAMIIWILTAIFKDALPLRYETWRFSHMLGFVVITILATLHVTSVGSHGQFQASFNLIWWSLCSASIAMVLYNYSIKPFIQRSQPFKLLDVSQISRTDWQVTIEKKSDSAFNFTAGQFVWLNTSQHSGGVKEHPFSIASCQRDLPKISFIIRNLGDYTSKLNQLTVGQDVYLDGPYGSMNLAESANAKAIVLIAGGAGIGPMLSLLRGLAEAHDPRPIRLIYGNNHMDQMVLQDEIKRLEKTMPNFKQQLACLTAPICTDIYQGVIDTCCIEAVIKSESPDDWTVYLCGPKPMITSVNKSLKSLKISRANIHFEHLSF
ncbi:ferric reductase-like transmembrane domain-containing protein [Amphritea sp. 1_MG-2023]|uniref:ferredoxin reductase family protein n=1 Tax=Amphritea sp. 1_MG-2023 TaxID=3062670 RepID=UPI0026E27D91|nr:ferric reductase-like transmembrane domain-containing protein [Amphritea sp. 1_MG-2023]MDO6562405.1 ferric reductase-like transmembrane domain-containing protein [Amphritea sp. 1_MG-2023]